ncbi:MAG: carbohydrate kinase [Bacteroidota bacterium]
MSKAVCYGEVLWDVFPTHKKIGGAPLNVALRLQSFGIEVKMISQVGKDPAGKDIKTYLEDQNMPTAHIGVNHEYDTGLVNVELNENGNASYDIIYPCAWDKIPVSEQMLEIVAESNALIFGSLICRDKVSKNTLMQLLDKSKFSVFDVNLRPPFYTKETLQFLMEKADFIKFNDEELYMICKQMGSPYDSLEQNIEFISKITKTNQICVTRGGHGAVLFNNGYLFENGGYMVKVIDTVGAGDSFLGTLIANLLKGEHPQKSLDLACAVGALVAGSKGANPRIEKEVIQKFMFP